MATLAQPTKGAFPLENVNPAVKKTKEWLLPYAMAAVGTANASPEMALGYRSRARYELIAAYAQARQPIWPYLNLLRPETDMKDTTLTDIICDHRIVPIIPKPRRIVTTQLQNSNADYDVTINPIDPQAATEIQDEAAALRAKVALRQALTQGGMPQMGNVPAIAQQPGEPDDLGGAEVAVLGLRHKAALKAELVIKQVLNGNYYDNMRELIAADLVDYGCAVVKDETAGTKITLRHVDMRGFICSPCMRADFSDMRYAGEIYSLPIAQIVADTDGKVTKEELERIYELSQSNTATYPVFYSDPSISGSWNGMFNQGKVQILDLTLISTDTDVREERTNKFGNKVFGKVKEAPNTNDEKIKSRKVERVYRVKWVVGTDIIYDFGLDVDVKRDPNDASRAKLPYHLQAGDVHDMIAYSRTEGLITFADSIQLRRMKVEHRFNTARPAGYTIDMSAMDQLAIGTAGEEKMTGRDILALLVTHGVLMWRSEDLIGDGKMNPPVAPLLSDLSDVIEYWNDIQRQLALMNQTLGLNEVTDASAPDPKRLTDPTQAAVIGTKNALADLFNAMRRMDVSISEAVLIRAQHMMKQDNAMDFVSALGAGTVTFLTAAPLMERYRFGFAVIDRPTPEQEAAFELEMQKALGENQIDIGDVAAVRDMSNLKERQQYLIYKVRKNKQEAQQFELQKTQQLTQGQAQSAQAASQMKMQELQMEFQLKSQLSAQEHKQRMDELIPPILGKNEDNRIAATGRIDSSYVQASGRDAVSIREANTKLIEHDKEDKAPIINNPGDLKTSVDPLTSAQHPIAPGIAKPFSFINPPQPAPAEAPPAPSKEAVMQSLVPQD